MGSNTLYTPDIFLKAHKALQEIGQKMILYPSDINKILGAHFKREDFHPCYMNQDNKLLDTACILTNMGLHGEYPVSEVFSAGTMEDKTVVFLVSLKTDYSRFASTPHYKPHIACAQAYIDSQLHAK